MLMIDGSHGVHVTPVGIEERSPAVLLPTNTVLRVWDIAALLLGMFSAIMTPFSLLVLDQSSAEIAWCGVGVDIFFLLDIVLSSLIRGSQHGAR